LFNTIEITSDVIQFGPLWFPEYSHSLLVVPYFV